MEKTDKEFQELKKHIRELIRLDFITPDEIPGMELYMDQLTRYMDQHLGSTYSSYIHVLSEECCVYQRHKTHPWTYDRKRFQRG